MNCCNIKVSMKVLVEKIKPLLGLDTYVESNGGTLTNVVLSTPTIKGAVSLDTDATASLCSALERCIRDYIAGTPFVDNAELVGSELVLKQGTTVISRISFGNLVPQIKADRFLSKVDYKKPEKQLVFTTSADGEQDQTFTIPLDDLINVEINLTDYAGDGLEAKGGKLKIKDALLNAQVDVEALAGDGLEARGNKLHIKNELCTLDVKTKSAYTVQDADDIILATGGEITFPSTISVGRAFTVIQTTDQAVTLKSDGGTINSPKDLGLTLRDKNAAVTVIKADATTFYAVGDLK